MVGQMGHFGSVGRVVSSCGKNDSIDVFFLGVRAGRGKGTGWGHNDGKCCLTPRWWQLKSIQEQTVIFI